MLSLNLKEILRNKSTFRGRYCLDPKDINLPADVGEITKPVVVEVEIRKDKSSYKVRLSIIGSVTLACSRCLTLFEKDISQSWVIKLEKYKVEQRTHLRPKDLEVSFYEDEENVNLEDIVREQILLTLPIKPLCNPECNPHINLEEHLYNPFSVLKNIQGSV